jgi:hypothetical protein
VRCFVESRYKTKKKDDEYFPKVPKENRTRTTRQAQGMIGKRLEWYRDIITQQQSALGHLVKHTDFVSSALSVSVVMSLVVLHVAHAVHARLAHGCRAAGAHRSRSLHTRLTIGTWHM